MKDLITKLFSKKADKPSQQKLDVAVAALMIEVLSADQNIDQRETEHTLKLLSDRYDLDNEELSECYKTAQSERQSAVDLHRFTQQICKELDNPQRIALVSELWQIALIDDDLDRHERHTIRKIASLLYLTEKDIILALERAKAAIA